MKRWWLVMLLASGACLPPDDRPEPGSVQVNVVRNDATANGFTTDDGWRIELDRFMTALGDIRLASANEERGATSTCNDYAITRYDRLFDFTVAERDRIGVVYGLGQCSVEFRLRSPRSDAILGEGTSESDRSLMRIETSDTRVGEERTVLLVRGRAARGAEVKEFFWSFLQGYRIGRCKSEEGGGVASIVDIAGGDALSLDIEVRAEELFRRTPADDAPLEFDRFAAADTDEDGVVTLAELDEVPVDLEAMADDIRDELPEERVEISFDLLFGEPTLGTLVYEILVARVTRFAGAGECEFQPRL